MSRVTPINNRAAWQLIYLHVDNLGMKSVNEVEDAVRIGYLHTGHPDVREINTMLCRLGETPIAATA